MPSTPSLIQKLSDDFPDIVFEESDTFQWSSDTHTILYNPLESSASQHILHELAHAILGHRTYNRDIELLKMEREAWAHAQDTLGVRYDILMEDSTREQALDSYRDWLHARSTCPNCKATGMETGKHLYKCPACLQTWRVNEARLCGLKRYSVEK